MDWTTIPFLCEKCKSYTQVLIDIEGENDYIFNDVCEECGEKVPQSIIKLIPDTVITYIVGQNHKKKHI
jgi:hypothetical protein